jgi:glutathione synthase
MGRLPAEGEIRANFRVGGQAAKIEATPRQREIGKKVGEVLRARGLLLAGLDFIGDWLTEINITSPTGLRQLNALYGLRLERDFWDAVESRL